MMFIPKRSPLRATSHAPKSGLLPHRAVPRHSILVFLYTVLVDDTYVVHVPEGVVVVEAVADDELVRDGEAYEVGLEATGAGGALRAESN